MDSRGPARIGLANLAGPHSAARTAAPAIGLGVALLAAVVLIQSSLIAEVTVAAVIVQSTRRILVKLAAHWPWWPMYKAVGQTSLNFSCGP